MKKLKLGVLGVSSHFVKRVLFPLKHSSSIEIYAIASRNYEKAKKFALKHDISKYYGSYEELLGDKDVDFVYIPLPNHLHVEYIKKSADAGKHVICEKPLALSYEKSKEAFDYTNTKGILLMEAFMYKLHPQWKRAWEIVQSGEIGKVRSIYCQFSYDNEDPSNIRNIKEYGGGGLYDIGVYAVSSARFMMDEEPKKVLCELNRHPEWKIDILSSGILDFGTKRSMFTVSTQAFPYQNVSVFGTSGVLSIKVPFNMYPDVPGEISVETSIGKRTIFTKPEDQYKLEFEEFARAISEKIPLPVSVKDSLSNARVIDALFESAKRQSWTEL
ncbi:MAG: Gfo/Idh/MocA family oxidoreductase [Kosmotoga sp.]|nr:MAG: Gfo/Idh/MocA family oxidoreductase [Kosmotoga sp.]